MNHNMRTWVDDIISSGRQCAFPLMAYAGIELTQVPLDDIVRNGAQQAACVVALAARYSAVASVTVMDLSVESEAFGSEMRTMVNEIPTIAGSIVRDAEDAERLTVPEIGSGRTSVYLEAASRAAAEIKDTPVFGCHIGPFSLAGRLCGMTETLMNVHTDPEMLHIVLQKTAEFLVNYARAFKEAGVNGIIIAEPAAGLISPDHCDEFSSQYIASIVNAVQDDRFMVILHNCGGIGNHAVSMASTGAAGLHFGNSADMMKVLTEIPSGILVLGNIDPVGVLKEGTEDDIQHEMLRLLRDTSGYSNFVLSTGCDVPPGTPLCNIDTFFRVLEEYNRKMQYGKCL
ncbi:MAG TPA: uroporphyrinogen decarboxylase family protein [Spirochaetota bacterium]|nr:uroporphyrinogen decarboxylase family protein [Spirochaetota bacterium]